MKAIDLRHGKTISPLRTREVHETSGMRLPNAIKMEYTSLPTRCERSGSTSWPGANLKCDNTRMLLFSNRRENVEENGSAHMITAELS